MYLLIQNDSEMAEIWKKQKKLISKVKLCYFWDSIEQ
jgi:hypothetical protein